MEYLGSATIYGEGARFLLFETDKLAGLLDLSARSSPFFALMTAFDLTLSDLESASGVADSLMTGGLAYLCAWGERCQPWHDLVDRSDYRFWQKQMGPEDVVMTTWHSKDSLEEALEYFAECASPTDGYSKGCQDYIVACEPQYAQRIRAYFSSNADHEVAPGDDPAKSEHPYWVIRRAVEKYGGADLELPPREMEREPPDFSGDEYKDYD